MPWEKAYNGKEQRESATTVSEGVERSDTGEPFACILARHLRRRTLLKGIGFVAAAPFLALTPPFLKPAWAEAATDKGLRFTPIAGNNRDEVKVSKGYQATVLLSWGQALFPKVPDLNTQRLDILLAPQGADLQARQFGYNCDFNGFFPLSHASSCRRGLLATNHEFTSEELMLPGWPGDDDPDRASFISKFPAIVSVMKAAHGISIVEVIQRDDQWHFKKDSPFNRRITSETVMVLTGPATGHPLLQTAADPSGKEVRGTLSNCGGGKTPWGTFLSCEENFDEYFGNFAGLIDQVAKKEKNRAKLERYTVFHQRLPLPSDLSDRGWELVDQRFDAAKHPTEAFRFGWIVEVDPYHPDSLPKKRTALGRFKHEGANTVVAPNGRVVVYCGDDTPFEYVYKFVSDKAYDPQNRTHNLNLLDRGVLYVARFKDDGAGEWLPLVFGCSPLNKEHGFNSQAEVLINTRRAADLVGATPMDRPEDIEFNPINGKVYIALTNNVWRGIAVESQGSYQPSGGGNASNPRVPNKTGHVIEIVEKSNDPTAATFGWEIFLLCGNPRDPEGQFLTSLNDQQISEQDTYFGGYRDVSQVSPLSSPDNLAIDLAGNLWIATDGKPGALNLSEAINNGLYAVPTEGKERGWLRQFLSGPRGCEVCGPEFTPDNATLFVGIQHPGLGGTINEPISHWPDSDGKLPRPSVIAVTKADGGRIGS